jgi:hypothetical protein
MNSPEDEHIPVAIGAIGIVFAVAFGCSEEHHEMSTATTHFASDSNAGSSRGMRFSRIGGGCCKPSNLRARLHGSGATRVNGGNDFCIETHAPGIASQRRSIIRKRNGRLAGGR